MSSLTVHHHADPQAAADAAARFILERITERLAEASRFSLALSGGSTPRLMLEALARHPVPWPQLDVFQVDERIAPAGDQARNLNMLRSALVGPGLLPQSNLHAMPVEATDLMAAASDYALDIAAVAGSPPILDLVHLGLGDDGHTASLLPGDAALAVTNADVALTQSYRGHRRMTLTYPILNRARWRLWLATGTAKTPMLTRLYAGDPGIPAAGVSVRDAVVFTDVEPPS